MKKKYLFTPGPTEVPEEVLIEISRPPIHHRKKDFVNIFEEAVSNLKRVFLSTGEVFIFASSGTGAMEAAVQNFTEEGDKALYIESGKFGERWGELCEVFGVKTTALKYEWGNAVDTGEVEEKLKKNKDIKAVFATLVETSTGTLHPIEELAKVVSKSNAIFIVDAVSGLGSDRIMVDKWGIDVVVSGSQKALMTPPGLSFICINEKAKSVYEKNSRKSYYWDIKKESKAMAKGQTSYTPSVNLITGLLQALKMINTEGIENTFARHEVLAKAAREGIKAMGLELFSSNPANGLTAVNIPSSDRIGGVFVKHIEEKYGVVFAGGQEKLKSKIFRIAHMGYYDKLDVIKALGVVEMALKELGVMDVLGKGVGAAMEVFTNNAKGDENNSFNF